MVQPWAEAGFRCLIVDLKHGAEESTERIGKGHVMRVRADVAEWLPPREPIVFAFPPCQHMAVSGRRWFAQ